MLHHFTYSSYDLIRSNVHDFLSCTFTLALTLAWPSRISFLEFLWSSSLINMTLLVILGFIQFILNRLYLLDNFLYYFQSKNPFIANLFPTQRHLKFPPIKVFIWSHPYTCMVIIDVVEILSMVSGLSNFPHIPRHVPWTYFRWFGWFFLYVHLIRWCP